MWRHVLEGPIQRPTTGPRIVSVPPRHICLICQNYEEGTRISKWMECVAVLRQWKMINDLAEWRAGDAGDAVKAFGECVLFLTPLEGNVIVGRKEQERNRGSGKREIK